MPSSATRSSPAPGSPETGSRTGDTLGKAKANNALIPLASDGSVKVRSGLASGTVPPPST